MSPAPLPIHFQEGSALDASLDQALGTSCPRPKCPLPGRDGKTPYKGFWFSGAEEAPPQSPDRLFCLQVPVLSNLPPLPPGLPPAEKEAQGEQLHGTLPLSRL